MTTLTQAVTTYEAQLNTVVTTFTTLTGAASAGATLATDKAGVAVTKAQESLDSAASAVATQTAINDIYYGARSSDPATKPSGAARAVGDEYFNTVTSRKMVFRSGGWLDFELSASNSASASEVSRQASEVSRQASEVSRQASEVSRLASGVQAGLAATAKTQAEAARDAANVIGKMAATTAEGLAATIGTGSTNRYFSTPSPESAELLILWRNDSGVAIEQKRYLSAASFDIAKAVARFGYKWGVVGSGKRIPLGLDENDDLVHLGQSIRGLITASGAPGASAAAAVASLSASGASAAAAVASLSAWVIPSPDIYCFGDSMTAGQGGTPYTTKLAALMPTRTIANKGVGGQTSNSIFSRWGSYPILITLPGNVVPASGTVDFVQALPSSLPIIHSGGGPISGSIGGITGVLTYVGQVTIYESYTLRFTRTTAGSAVPILPNEPFIPDTAATAFSTPIFWAARNSIGLQNGLVDAATQMANVMDWHEKAIEFYKPRDKHFLILGPSNRNDEYSGSAVTVGTMTGSQAYDVIVEVNRRLKERWPKQYIDVRKLVVNARTPGTSPEDTAYARDVPPPSLLSDLIHYNTAGYAIVASAVSQRLTNLNW